LAIITQLPMRIHNKNEKYGTPYKLCKSSACTVYKKKINVISYYRCLFWLSEKIQKLQEGWSRCIDSHTHNTGGNNHSKVTWFLSKETIGFEVFHVYLIVLRPNKHI